MPHRFHDEELQVWQAFYSLEPWGDLTNQLARILGAIMKDSAFERYLPIETKLNVPLEDVGLDNIRKRVAIQVRGLFAMAIAAGAKVIQPPPKKKE